MKGIVKRRPSPAMAVSSLALTVALGGTAIAASNSVSGDALIKTHSLSGNRLRNKTVTGNQINLNTLGKVPSAKVADSATSASKATSATNATNATNALNATNATNATNAANLGGLPPTSFILTGRVNDKVTTVGGTAAGNAVTLFTSGPFTVGLNCAKNSSTGVTATVYVISTEANTVVNGQTPTAVSGTPAGTPQAAVPPVGSATGFMSNGGIVDVMAPSGAVAWFGLEVLVNNPSASGTNDCTVSILRLI
jgi:hypothetical protein